MPKLTPKLTIVANIKAKPDKVDFVKAALEDVMDITRAEPGCQQFDLHQDNDDPAHFLLYENWDSRELWQNHMNAAHIQAYAKKTEGSIDLFTLNEMTHFY
jgi:quinol monooxygenase YgiN